VGKKLLRKISMGKLLNEMGNCPFASPLIAPLSLVTISEFLNRCSFDPDANRQTNKQTNFFHMTLLTVEGILSKIDNDIFGRKHRKSVFDD